MKKAIIRVDHRKVECLVEDKGGWVTVHLIRDAGANDQPVDKMLGAQIRQNLNDHNGTTMLKSIYEGIVEASILVRATTRAEHHPFVSTPHDGNCSSCNRKRTDSIHNSGLTKAQHNAFPKGRW